MSSLKEEIIKDYLIEEHSDLNLPLEELILYDYCLRKNEHSKKKSFSDCISRIASGRINKESEEIHIDENSLGDLVFLDCYESLLKFNSPKILNAPITKNDLKALIIFEVILKKMRRRKMINNNLEKELKSLALEYQKKDLDKKVNKEIKNLKKKSLELCWLLKKPLNKEEFLQLDKIKSYIDKKKKEYRSHLKNHQELGMLIMNMENSIKTKIKDYISCCDSEYSKIKNEFESKVWNSERRINYLIRVISKLSRVKSNYQIVSYKKGVQRCNSLERKMRFEIERYNEIKKSREYIFSTKKESEEFYKEFKKLIKSKSTIKSIRKINQIYALLERRSKKKFLQYIPEDLKESYYFNIKKTLNNIQNDCKTKIMQIVKKSESYRKKIRYSFFSLRTEKLNKKLQDLNKELEAWSRCKVI